MIIQVLTMMLIPGYVFAAGGGTLIQSGFGDGANGGDFDLVVQEGDQVCHYFRSNDEEPFLWEKTDCFGHNVTSAPALIQSDFDVGANGGNFEVVVRQGNQLCHWWGEHDEQSSEPRKIDWKQSECFANNVTSAPTLIQSAFVGEGVSVDKFVYSCMTNAGCTVKPASIGCDIYYSGYEAELCHEREEARCLERKRYCEALARDQIIPPRPNFEVVAQQGNRLCHWWRNNDKTPFEWRQTYCFDQ
jgi:hypothetical protein